MEIDDLYCCLYDIFFLQIDRKMESTGIPTFAQDSTTNSQSIRSKTNPTWEHVSEEMYSNGRKSLTCLYCKKVTKGRGIHQ